MKKKEFINMKNLVFINEKVQVPIINCHVKLHSSSAKLYGSSFAELYQNSCCELHDKSSAELYNSSFAKLYGNSSAELHDSSYAELHDSSYAELYNNSFAELYHNSSAKLYENSLAYCYYNSSVELHQNSFAELHHNSFAELHEDSFTKLNNNSSCKLSNRSSAKLYDNSFAELHDNSSAELYENSSAILFSASKVELYHNSTIIEKYIEKTNIFLHDNAKRCLQEKFQNTKFSFVERCERIGESIVLYKVVNNDYYDFHSRKIKYEIGKEVICPDFDPDETRQCGGRLHLSPTIAMALKYKNNGKILKCLVDLDDFLIYQDDLTKVRCKKIFVLEEVNRKGEKI